MRKRILRFILSAILRFISHRRKKTPRIPVTSHRTLRKEQNYTREEPYNQKNIEREERTETESEKQ